MHGMNYKENFGKFYSSLPSDIKPGENLTKSVVISNLLIAVDPCLVLRS